MRSQLWLYFAAIIFSVLILTAILLYGLVMLLYSMGFVTVQAQSVEGSHSGAPILITVVFSVILGLVLSLFVTQTILKPIAEFSKVSTKVALGDFSVRVKENYRISEIKELGRNFNGMTNRLSQMESLSADFINNVSHEFNTPLNSIEGYATLLQDPNIGEDERQEYLSMIIHSTKQLGSLSGNILRLSNLERHEELAEVSPFRMDEQIRQILLVLEPLWSGKELSLKIDLEKCLYVGNEQLLWHVWQNLLSNAIKFSDSFGTVSVSLVQTSQVVTVTVTDEGSGMDEVTVGRAFEKFYQGDNSRKSEGNGLGLALAGRVIALSDGEINVESTNGVGTTFTVSLPVRSAIV